jgi:DNA-binding cell septation regulator SpoVG
MIAETEVLELRRVTGAGALRALVKVRLGAVLVRGVRIIQQDGGEPWIALPQVPARRRVDGSGSGWSRIIEVVDPAVSDQLRDAVLRAWEAA